MLTERRQQLLQMIVEEYIDTAQPVGSGSIVGKYALKISPATVRNEMARLEEEGYIVQPHTSAGRIPTDIGYRYYVETLMREERLPESEAQTIRHQFHQVARQWEEWAHLAAAVLAARLHNAAVVTAPHSHEPRLRWLELVSLHEQTALLIAVLQEARILRQTIPLTQPFTQEELDVMGRHLTAVLAGQTAAGVLKAVPGLPYAEDLIAEVVGHLLGEADSSRFEVSVLEGLLDLLRQPEFAQGARILDLLEALEERNLPKAIPVSWISEEQVQIIIGGEHPTDAMRICSVVVARYVGPSGLGGTVSVVGPTRMRYPQTISLVRYVSSLMEEMLDRYFG